MKKLTVISLIIIFFVTVFPLGEAKANSRILKIQKKSVLRDNKYKIGTETIEKQIKSIIQPLINCLDNNSKEECDRMCAALKLHKLCDRSAMKIIRDMSHFEKNKSLRDYCRKIYFNFVNSEIEV